MPSLLRAPAEGAKIARQGTSATGRVIMRVPQVSDRVKEAPATALRGFLAGVGQLLLITDRLRNKTGAGEDAPQAPAADAAPDGAPDAAESVAEPTQASAAPAEEAPAPAPAAKKRDFNKTGNVRVLAGEAETPAAKAPAAKAPAAEAPAEAPAAEAPAEAVSPAGAAAALPLANYDELSVASLRARLRNLTVTQVTDLVTYEKAHAGRTEVITMFERRIAKLEAGG